MSFWQAKAKIRRSDTLFSLLIRNRDNWHCQYRFKCFGRMDYRYNKGALHCSHFIKRGHESTRYDLSNCDAACRMCHNFVETTAEGQKALEAWKLKQLGERKYKLLKWKAEQYQHKDEKLAIMWCKALLKEQKQNLSLNQIPMGDEDQVVPETPATPTEDTPAEQAAETPAAPSEGSEA